MAERKTKTGRVLTDGDLDNPRRGRSTDFGVAALKAARDTRSRPSGRLGWRRSGTDAGVASFLRRSGRQARAVATDTTAI